jgi:hypothetical protein
MAVPDLVGSATLVARTVTAVATKIPIGDVYQPVALIAPGPDATLHVTAPLGEFCNVAVKRWVCEGYIDVGPVTLTKIGIRVTVADPARVELATLVAVTVTVCCAEIGVGAVYSPEPVTVPTAGLRDHVTAVFAVPVTVAVNCCVCVAVSGTDAGAGVTQTPPTRVKVAVPKIAPLNTLVALTVIVCPAGITAGAVYSPEPEMLPTAGVILHVTV